MYITKEEYTNKVLEYIAKGWSVVYSKNRARKDLMLSTYCAVEFAKDSPEFMARLEQFKNERIEAKKYGHDRKKI